MYLRTIDRVGVGLLALALAFAPSPLRADVTGLTTPQLGVTVTDQPVAFSAATFDAPALVGTLDPGDGIQLEVTPGSLSLATTAGLAFITGDGVEDPTLIFTGPDDTVAAALDGLTYLPPAGYAGGATVTMTLIGTPTLVASWRVAVHTPFADWKDERDAIISGLTVIHGGVQPGHMVAFGLEAYEALRYPGSGPPGTLVAFASWGAGRVVAVPDHQMLDMGSYGSVSGPFYRKSLAWLAGSAALSVKIVTKNQGTADWLTGDGYTDVTVTDDGGLAGALAGADVYVPGWLGSTVSAETLEVIGDFVRGGGGLFIADYGVGYTWWWGKPIHEAPGNVLLREAGIGFVGGNTGYEAGLTLFKTPSEQINGEALLTMLGDKSLFTASEQTLGLRLLERIYDALPPGDPLAARLDAAVEVLMEEISPTPLNPISGYWEQALLERESTLLEETPLAELEKHRTADEIFGPVPDDAPRVSGAVLIDPAVTRWHTTGYYLAPGELATVTAPAEVIGEGFTIQVSGHVDDISNTDTWLRMPRVDRVFDLDATEIPIASPFGGALYVNVGTTSTDLPPFEVTFSGVVEAPRFVLGETTDAAWTGGIRDLPAPYAEFVSDHLSLSLPASMIRELDDAEAVAAFWDEVVAIQDALGMVEDLRTNAERINIDVQVSWGYLHAGYPVQGPLVAGPELVDMDGLLQSGSWGWFHELGHEAQRRPDKSWGWDNAYTFDGAVEATVNIFTSTVYDVMEIPNRGGWSWTGDRIQVMKKALEGLGGGGSFATLDVGFKLAMFLQLRDAWSWGAFQALFAGYNAALPEELPATDQEERDQLLVRFSQIIGHDLGPFMGDAWGIACSDAARAAVAPLPDWLPALGGIEGAFIVPAQTSKAFDLAGEALSFDGVAMVTVVTPPDHGLLSPGGDGTWTYEPMEGFQGTDGFEYTVTSSTGHVMTSEVTLDVTSHGVLLERWFGIAGSEVALLLGDPGYPDVPDETLFLSTFEAPQNVANDFGARLRAFLVPQVGGEYTFWIASDDNSELWLSPTQAPQDAALIAKVPAWSGPGQWDLYALQQSAPVPLEAGHVYYIEALHKEGGGADHLSVAWALEGQDPAVIGGDDLRIYRVDNVAPVGVDDEAETTVDVPVYINVLSNDTDADGDPLYILDWEASPGAEVAAWEGEVLVYTPPPGFSGPDTFTYTVADGYGAAATAEVTVWVLYDCSTLPCGDDNPCTDNSCEPLAGCVITNNALPCEDGDACTDDDVCAAGACLSGPIKSCDDGDLCTDDLCDPVLGCLSGDPTDCDDFDPCTDDSCDPASGCVYSYNTIPCSDGDACTDGDACAQGTCVPGPALGCNDGDPCTVDGCLAASGCFNTPVPDCCNGDLDCAPGFACQALTCEPVQCAPCEDSSDCGNGGLCFSMESGDYCLSPCDDGCPDETVCAGTQAPACWPFVGDCVCTPGAGEGCDGDQWVELDSCGNPVEVIEDCAYGCVADTGCCPAGTQAVDGDCIPDVVGEDLVVEPDVVIAPDVIEAEEIWAEEIQGEETIDEELPMDTDAPPADLAPGDDTAPPDPDAPAPPLDVPTTAPDTDDPGVDTDVPDDDLVTSSGGRGKGGCAAASPATPPMALLILLAAAWMALRRVRRRL
jgi:hypothetical protein